MAELNRTKGIASDSAPDGVVAAVLRQAETWTRAQCELLSGVEAMWAHWMERQRAAIDASTGALKRLTECRNLADLIALQQQFLADALRRNASDVKALTSDAAALGERVARAEASRLACRGPPPSRGTPPESAGDSRPPQREAAE